MFVHTFPCVQTERTVIDGEATACARRKVYTGTISWLLLILTNGDKEGASA